MTEEEQAELNQRMEQVIANAKPMCPGYARYYKKLVQAPENRRDEILDRLAAHVRVCGCRMQAGAVVMVEGKR